MQSAAPAEHHGNPHTLLRWHRCLVAQKWDYTQRCRAGRPGIMREISELIVRMALENPKWGYTRIQVALANLRHAVARGMVANLLKANGIEPAPERGKHTRWPTFLKAHWRVFSASDFFSIELWTGRGLVTHYVLSVISLADRIVEVLGVTARSDEAWIMQVGRSLVDTESGTLRGKGYLIIDQDGKYSERFRHLIRESGCKVIRLPPMSPNLNAYAERFVRSIKDECLHRIIFIGRSRCAGPLRITFSTTSRSATIRYWRTSYSDLSRAVVPVGGGIYRRPCLGGMLSFYYRAAA